MIDDIFFLHGSTFDVPRLCREVGTHRFTLLAAIGCVLVRHNPAWSGPDDIFGRLAAMAPDRRAFFLADPAFSRWLDKMALALQDLPVSEPELIALLDRLPGLFSRIGERCDSGDIRRIRKTDIAIQRDDLDPIIKAATPPTFDFETADAASPGADLGEEARTHFAASLDEAFANIAACDPQRHETFKQLIRVVGYLPDGDFRSCSAARYQGVIYLAGREETTIDLEESIVHEAAHQLLYKIGELQPITDREALRHEYELPWSGSVRDVFGYFHAYFVYLQIVEYFMRRAETAGDARPETVRKLELIHRGLELATDDLVGAPGMTPYGKALFGVLADRVAAIGA